MSFVTHFFQNYTSDVKIYNDHDFEFRLVLMSFLILDDSVFPCIECGFISRSYWKIQVLSQVMHFLKQTLASSSCSMSAQFPYDRHSFYFGVITIGTILTQSLFMWRFPHMVFLSMFTATAIIQTSN